MFNLHVDVYSPVGEFRGNFNKQAGTQDEIIGLRDKLQNIINNVDYVVLIGRTGAEITLPSQVLKTSVFIFTIKEAE